MGEVHVRDVCVFVDIMWGEGCLVLIRLCIMFGYICLVMIAISLADILKYVPFVFIDGCCLCTLITLASKADV